MSYTAIPASSSGGGNLTARYAIEDADATLPNAQDISLLSDGLLKHSVTAGVSTIARAVPGTDYATPGPLASISVSGSAIQDFNFTGLHGDTDGGYIIVGRIYNSTGGNVTYTCWLNGSVSGLNYYRIYHNGGLAPSSDAPSTWGQLSAGGVMDFRMSFENAARGPNGNDFVRSGFVNAVMTNNNSPVQLTELCFTTTDKTNEIVQVGVHSSAAGGMGIGSFCRLFTVPII